MKLRPWQIAQEGATEGQALLWDGNYWLPGDVVTESPAAASETVAGILEIATQAETDTGTDDARAVTPLKLATRLTAVLAGYQPAGSYQPLDSDLTAIAALATTAYGRALLTLADQAALLAAIGAATTTASGVVELATDAEAIAGTDAVSAVTPASLAAALDALSVTATTALIPLTTDVGGVPDFVWDEDNQLVLTEVAL